MSFTAPRPRIYPSSSPAAAAGEIGQAAETGLTTTLSRIFGAAGAGYYVGQILGKLGGGYPGGKPTPQQQAAGIPGTLQTPTATPLPTAAQQTAAATSPPQQQPPGRNRFSKKKAAAVAAAGAGTAGLVNDPGGFFSTIGQGITDTLDFLKLLAWLFHPRNLLRAVELIVGLVLMAFGLSAALQARGERAEGFTTSEMALSRSELGRVATELGRAARTGSKPRHRSAPHATRRRALAQRYTREERVRERERKGEKPAGHSKRTKGSGAGTKKTS